MTVVLSKVKLNENDFSKANILTIATKSKFNTKKNNTNNRYYLGNENNQINLTLWMEYEDDVKDIIKGNQFKNLMEMRYNGEIANFEQHHILAAACAED